MTMFTTWRAGVTALALGVTSVGALAETELVSFNQLVASSTVTDLLGFGDALIVDSVITGQTGSLLQQVTFTLDSGITAIEGSAVWQVSTAGSNLPRLTGFNVDIFNIANTLVLSDTSVVVANGYATSLLAGALTGGTYTMRITGNAIRDTVVNVAIAPVPEPQTYAMMAVGLAMFGALALRRQRKG